MDISPEILKLAMAVLLGALLGFERTIAGKPAGIRTFALVSLSSALFVLAGDLINQSYLGRVNFDPSRVLASVAVGVGFLGAGVIFVKQGSLKGLTTAAGIWVSAAVGALCGFGFFEIAFFATMLSLLVFTLVWFLENKVRAIKLKNEPAKVEKTSTQK